MMTIGSKPGHRNMQYFLSFLFRRFRGVIFVVAMTISLFAIHTNKFYLQKSAKFIEKGADKMSFSFLPRTRYFEGVRRILKEKALLGDKFVDSYDGVDRDIVSDIQENLDVQYNLSQRANANDFRRRISAELQEDINVNPNNEVNEKKPSENDKTNVRANDEEHKTSLPKNPIQHETTKEPKIYISSTKETDSRRLWINKFTTNIPKALMFLLQDILSRDFEKTNPTLEEGASDSGRCTRGYFRLKGMNQCHKWLECGEIEQLETGRVFGNGVGKIINAAKWKGQYDVAVVKLREDRVRYSMFVNRVQSGVDNILLTQPSPYTTQVVGYCVHGNNTVLVMEGCEHGNFRQFYSGPTFRKLPVIDKFKIAIQLVAELDYLHRGLGLPRVNCDLHTLSQSFGQYIVSYDNRLFMNDLDELPIVDKERNKLAVCDSEPFGVMAMPEFLAPEIHYTPEEHEVGKHKKRVDEKSDVWKIPDLVANILTAETGFRKFEHFGNISDYYLKDDLQSIHKKCKLLNPAERPTSREILVNYLHVYKDLLSKYDESG